MQRLIAMLAITLFAPAVLAQATVMGAPSKPQTPQQPQQNVISVGSGKYKLGYDGRGKGKYGKPESLADAAASKNTGATTGPNGEVPAGMTATGIAKPAPAVTTTATTTTSTTNTTTSEPAAKKMRSDSALRSDSTPTTTTTSSTTPSEKTAATPETKTTAPAQVSAPVLVGGKLVTQ